MSYSQMVLTGFGGPDRLELRTVEDVPEPGPGEVRVRVLVTSAAFTDVMIRKGMYPDVKEKPPFVPGYDLVGIIDALTPREALFTATVAPPRFFGLDDQDGTIMVGDNAPIWSCSTPTPSTGSKRCATRVPL